MMIAFTGGCCLNVEKEGEQEKEVEQDAEKGVEQGVEVRGGGDNKRYDVFAVKGKKEHVKVEKEKKEKKDKKEKNHKNNKKHSNYGEHSNQIKNKEW